jgi:hypothetical protein
MRDAMIYARHRRALFLQPRASVFFSFFENVGDIYLGFLKSWGCSEFFFLSSLFSLFSRGKKREKEEEDVVDVVDVAKKGGFGERSREAGPMAETFTALLFASEFAEKERRHERRRGWFENIDIIINAAESDEKRIRKVARRVLLLFFLDEDEDDDEKTRARR